MEGKILMVAEASIKTKTENPRLEKLESMRKTLATKFDSMDTK